MLQSQISSGVRVSTDDEEAKKIVQRVSCLPLGIQASIGLINEDHCTLKDYNDQYDSPRKLLEEVSVQHTYRHFAPYEKALADVWFDLLARLEKDSDSRSMIDVFALLDSDGIPEELFMNKLNKASLETTGFIQNRVKCIKILLKGLVGRNETIEGRTLRNFNIHRLLQVCTQLRMSTESRQRAFNHAINLLCASITPNWYSNWPTIKQEYKDVFPHVQSVHSFYLAVKMDGEVQLDVPVEFLEMTRKAAASVPTLEPNRCKRIY